MITYKANTGRSAFDKHEGNILQIYTVGFTNELCKSLSSKISPIGKIYDKELITPRYTHISALACPPSIWPICQAKLKEKPWLTPT